MPTVQDPQYIVELDFGLPGKNGGEQLCSGKIGRGQNGAIFGGIAFFCAVQQSCTLLFIYLCHFTEHSGHFSRS